MLTISSVGILATEPEQVVIPTGSVLVKGSICFNGSNKNPTFKRYECYVKTKPFMDYMTKGKPVFILGEIQTKFWESNGEKRSMEVILVRDWSFIGGRRDESDLSNEPNSSSESSLSSEPNSSGDVEYLTNLF
jgi:single-stranded DNA-binding protein